MIKKIGILILIGIISMCTVIPMALADNNDVEDVCDNPDCNITCDPEDCSACENGGVTLTEDGGDAVSWLWSTNETTQSINVTSSGNYEVTITDADGCEKTCDVDVTIYPLPDCNITCDPEDCSACENGGVTLTEDGGDAVSWLWSTNETTQSINVTSSGNYEVTITDADGCEKTCDVDVTVYDEIEIKDEENIFKIIWYKLESMLSFFENGGETTVNVKEEHPSEKAHHGAIVSIIARIINKLESVVGKTHGMIMRAVAKTNWGKQIKEKDTLINDVDIEEKGEKEKPEKGKKPNKGKKPDVIPPKKGF